MFQVGLQYIHMNVKQTFQTVNTTWPSLNLWKNQLTTSFGHADVLRVRQTAACHWSLHSSRFTTQQTNKTRNADVSMTTGWQWRQKMSDITTINITRKPCCRRETARCRSCSCFRFKVRHLFTVSLREDELRKPRLQSSKHIVAKQNLTQNGD